MSSFYVGERCVEIEAIADSHRKGKGEGLGMNTCRIETANKDFKRMYMVGLSRLLKDRQM